MCVSVCLCAHASQAHEHVGVCVCVFTGALQRTAGPVSSGTGGACCDGVTSSLCCVKACLAVMTSVWDTDTLTHSVQLSTSSAQQCYCSSGPNLISD